MSRLLLHELAAAWRWRAAKLDSDAIALRREGYTREAEDAEAAAQDYRSEAELLELEAAPLR